MTSEEIQRKLDELEEKRNAMRDAQERHQRESDSVIANIRHTVSTLQKNVEEIVESHNGTRSKRNSTRT